MTRRPRTREQLALRSRQQQAAASLSRHALGSRDLDALMCLATTSMADTLGAELSGVFELISDQRTLRLRAGHGWEPGLVGEAEVRLGPGSQAGYTLGQDDVVTVADLAREERFAEPFLLAQGVVSGASAVIQADGSAFGVLTVHARHRLDLSDDDQTFLDTVANVLGHAIEQSRAEQALVEREARLQMVMEQVPAVLFTIDAGMRITLVMGGGAALNVDPEALLGRTVAEAIGDLDTDGSRMGYALRTLQGESCSFLTNWDDRQLQAHAEPLRDAEGRVRGAVALFVDVTEVTRAREELERLVDSMRRLEDERQDLVWRLLTAQRDERRRVAGELHDDLGQLLTSASLFAHDLEEEIDVEHRERVAHLGGLIADAASSVRRIAWGLRPTPLEACPLVTAIKRLTEELTATHRVEVDFQAAGDAERVPPEIETVVYRVAQEALTNAVRHGRAKSASVVVGYHGGSVTMVVEDDGVGFDPATDNGRGMGLKGIRDRARSVGGTVVVESSPAHGTTVRLDVPTGDRVVLP